MKITESTAFREIYAAFVIYHSSVIFGVDTSFTSFYLQGRDGTTLIDESVMGSINMYTRFFGSLTTILLVDRIGRKRSVEVMFVIASFGWWIIAYSQSKTSLYVGRILTGLATGAVTPSIVYTSEISSKERRGMLVGVQTAAASFGMSLPMIVIYFYDSTAMAKLSLFVALSGLTQLIYIPESYYWYVVRGDREKAKQSLSWYRKSSTSEDIDTELGNIERSFVSRNFNKSNFIDTILERRNFTAFLVVLLISALQSGCGRIPIVTHTEHFFVAFHTAYDSKKVVLILGFVDFVGCFCFSSLIDRFKRRNFLYFNIAVLVCCLIGVEFYDLVLRPLHISRYVSALPIILLYMYLIVCLSGLVAVNKVLSAEMITHEYRGTALSLAQSIVYLIMATYSYIFPYVLERVDVHLIIFYFLINLILIAVVVRLFAPETAGKALYEYREDVADEEQTAKLLVDDEPIVSGVPKLEYESADIRL